MHPHFTWRLMWRGTRWRIIDAEGMVIARQGRSGVHDPATLALLMAAPALWEMLQQLAAAPEFVSTIAQNALIRRACPTGYPPRPIYWAVEHHPETQMADWQIQDGARAALAEGSWRVDPLAPSNPRAAVVLLFASRVMLRTVQRAQQYECLKVVQTVRRMLK